MPRVEIYATPFCPFCVAAKRLLKEKGAQFAEINVMMDRAERRRMMERAGGRHSVPQIFIDDRHIGGCDELYDLERQGELEPLLRGAAV